MSAETDLPPIGIQQEQHGFGICPTFTEMFKRFKLSNEDELFLWMTFMIWSWMYTDLHTPDTSAKQNKQAPLLSKQVLVTPYSNPVRFSVPAARSVTPSWVSATAVTRSRLNQAGAPESTSPCLHHGSTTPQTQCRTSPCLAHRPVPAGHCHMHTYIHADVDTTQNALIHTTAEQFASARSGLCGRGDRQVTCTAPAPQRIFPWQWCRPRPP